MVKIPLGSLLPISLEKRVPTCNYFVPNQPHGNVGHVSSLWVQKWLWSSCYFLRWSSYPGLSSLNHLGLVSPTRMQQHPPDALKICREQHVSNSAFFLIGRNQQLSDVLYHTTHQKKYCGGWTAFKVWELCKILFAENWLFQMEASHKCWAVRSTPLK